MSVRLLAFVLLIWFPAVLHAQKAEQPCVAPQLDHGYLVLKKEKHSHEKELIYACDDGYKPTAEGWWATSTCENGQWSPKPQCIDETSCLPPTIPNGNYLTNSNGFYPERRAIVVKCDVGYELNDQNNRIRCENGTWPPLPVCEKSPNACDEPPQIPHAVIINQGYQEVFGDTSRVVYECKDGYTTDGRANQATVFCSSGNWTETPTCQRFCVIDPKEYARHPFVVTELRNLREGEITSFPCPQWRGYYSILKCTHGRITYTSCCHEHDINRGLCY